MTPTYAFPRPAVTVDVVVLTLGEAGLEVLLIQRGRAPFKGYWATPGGFVDMDEDLPTAARRELKEETGMRAGALREIGAFGKVDRDPRGRTIGIAYLALLRGRAKVHAGDDAAEVGWFDAGRLPRLAFDHVDVMRRARETLRGWTLNGTAAFALVPPKFTLAELRRAFEVILDRDIDAAIFRRRMLASGALEDAGAAKRGRARLYRLARHLRRKQPADVHFAV